MSSETVDFLDAFESICTPRQKEVLGLLDRGMKVSEVATELKVTRNRIWQIVQILRRKSFQAKTIVNWNLIQNEH